MPNKVTLVEVGARDGLQNEMPLSHSIRKELIEKLYTCGFESIEIGSIVSKKYVPAMADSDHLYKSLSIDIQNKGSMLVANMLGMMKAIKCGCKEVAIFTSSSDSFCKRNIGCSVKESIERFKYMMILAKEHKVKVRGYVSCVVACPYEGKQSVEKVVNVVRELIDMGCYQVSLGDTIGVGTTHEVKKLWLECLKYLSNDMLAVHFHDTYGQALANIYALLPYGLRVIDCAIGGLGGCPYAIGSQGNVASEDVIYMLHGMGIKTKIDLERLINTSWWICKALNIRPRSKVALAHKINESVIV